MRRIAIICSPRCGSSWARSVIARSLALEEIAVFNYLDAKLPLNQNCILHVHWYREPNFQKFIKENNFRVIVLARHPLDILVSVLNFVKHEPLTSRWLGGNAAIPVELKDCNPSSKLFLEYALSWEAENLLSISYQWWHEAAAIKVTYETLVNNSEQAFGDIFDALDAPKDGLQTAIAHFTVEYFKKLSNRHGWIGVPGLWRKLIPSRDALQIYKRHSRIFSYLGYSALAYPLSRARAARNWEALQSNERGIL